MIDKKELFYNNLIKINNIKSKSDEYKIIKKPIINYGNLNSFIPPRDGTKIDYTPRNMSQLTTADLQQIARQIVRTINTRQNTSTITSDNTQPTNNKNSIIESFMKDITEKEQSENFRGWILPNGQLMSEYNDNTMRQDHSRLVKLFMDGLELFDNESYTKLMDLYAIYQSKTTIGDVQESFAVEVLGWIQVSHFGQKRVIYRAERWQEKLVRPFLVDYGFNYVICNNGRSYEIEFASLYEHIDEIIKLGLEKKQALVLK